ncbi:MAG: hypothetical protein PUG88_00910 [Eubacterium coprostanoligenes]|uniref:hypothetical protein n=1 Tax=Eubacterium coprostanoligenes TaxID=290054 RepID=UPI0023F29932|nr:hypothetical protein [Eubacterium coprostanoligenes]MDD7357406.1 hypothetical protein [Eubacterium coprostanoligenes]
MKKLIKSITCLALVAALVASLAGCAKLNYVTNGTITAIQEVKSGDWKNAGKDGESDASAEEDVSVLDKSFEPNTYGGVEFKSLEDVANYYVEAYNYTKTLTAQYKDADGNTKTFYKLLGTEDLQVGDVMIDGKANSTINSLVPSIVGPMFDANSWSLVPSGSREPEYDNNLDDNTRKNDNDYRTSAFKAEYILDANVVDNGDGTITLTIQPKQEELAFRGEGPQGSFFEVLGDITGAVKSITVLSFTEGDASDNVKVMYKGGTGSVTIDTKTKEIVSAHYTMVANVDVTHASIAIIKDKSASVKITYTNEYPASDEYLKERRGITRL